MSARGERVSRAGRAARVGAACALALAALGCGTLATPAGDDDAVRPSAQAGPFRDLKDAEAGQSDAPNVLKRSRQRPFSDPAPVDLGDGTALGAVALYVVAPAADERPALWRYPSLDGRTFDALRAEPDAPVLEASEPWEGEALHGPAVLRVGGEWRLYYGAAGGIGLARSSDGVTFTKDAAPVLAADSAAAWEEGEAPSHPTVVQRGDTFHLFYGAAGRIGEATSADGVAFTRADAPVLEPGDPDTHAGAWVGEPFAVLATSAEGRPITRVYYATRDTEGLPSVGLAARYGFTGPLAHSLGPAFPPKRDPRAPAVLVFPRYSLMYVAQNAGATTALSYSAVAAAVAPGLAVLPPVVPAEE